MAHEVARYDRILKRIELSVQEETVAVRGMRILANVSSAANTLDIAALISKLSNSVKGLKTRKAQSPLRHYRRTSREFFLPTEF